MPYWALPRRCEACREAGTGEQAARAERERRLALPIVIGEIVEWTSVRYAADPHSDYPVTLELEVVGRDPVTAITDLGVRVGSSWFSRAHVEEKVRATRLRHGGRLMAI